jgi:hypothetical protein
MATPATWGEDIEVPLMVWVAVFEPIQPAVMLTPGPKISTQVPKFEKLARASALLLAATVIADGVRAGDWVQASALLFPADTA